MPRRSFVVQSLVLTAGSMLAAACGTGRWETAPEPTLTDLGTGGLTISLSAFPSLAHVGGIATVPTAGGASVAIVRRSDAQYDAFWTSCPHQGTTIAIQGDGFVCPNHGARFTENGIWAGGQPTGNLRPVPFTYDAARGTITLGVEPPPNAPPTRSPRTLEVVLANSPELATVGGIALFGLNNGYPAALIRIAEASYLALSPICPHRGWYVDPAPGGFHCPGHGANFSVRGIWTGGQPTTNLTELASTFDATKGTVTIIIP